MLQWKLLFAVMLQAMKVSKIKKWGKLLMLEVNPQRKNAQVILFVDKAEVMYVENMW